MDRIGTGYEEVVLFKEPRKFLDTLPQEMQNMSQMSEFDTGFVCGLIKKYRPKKILEVGTFTGATASVIMNCAVLLKEEPQIYSLDLAKTHNIGKTVNVGFVAEYAKEILKYKNYKLFTGDLLAARIEEIGGNIDFLILDTVHRLPGEILDFLVALPYLSKDAVVVMHDMVLNLSSATASTDFDAYSNRVLFDAVTAEKKYYMAGGESEEIAAGLPNIGAFQLNDKTRTQIRDVFSTLAYTWSYFPEAEQLNKYMTAIETHYSADLINLLKRILAAQKVTAEKKQVIAKADSLAWRELLLKVSGNDSGVVIYGSKDFASVWYKLLRKMDIHVRAFVVSDGRKIPTEWYYKKDLPIYHLSELPQEYSNSPFVIAVYGQNTYDEIVETLQSRGYTNILFYR